MHSLRFHVALIHVCVEFIDKFLILNHFGIEIGDLFIVCSVHMYPRHVDRPRSQAKVLLLVGQSSVVEANFGRPRVGVL